MADKYIDIDDQAYPQLLREIHHPPERLYYIGNIDLLKSDSVAVVGARRATEYGKWVSYNLAKTLAAYGLTVVSGMAWGVDAWAHKGALAAEGNTVAVLGCGVDICYPKSNLNLMKDIVQRGLVISELKPGTHATIYTFPRRNRIISGLSLATAVVEAGIKSGSLITAERAAEQGRYVYAVPGNIDRGTSLGCNKLIQDGAMPIALLDDIISDLGISKSLMTEKRCKDLGKDERRVYEAVSNYGEMTVDEICRETRMQARAVNGVVTVLEMKGLVETAIGRVFPAK